MPKVSKPLTDSQVKKSKPTDKAYKLTDGAGLYLYVSTTGVKSWRIDYAKPVTKKRVTLTLGLYPAFTLAQARIKRGEIKALLADGIDPQQQKIDDARELVLKSNNTFAAIAEEYLSRKTHVTEATIYNNRRQISVLNKFIGNKPIDTIKPIDVLEACRSVESKGYLETANKVRSVAGQVFRYAVQTSRCERDITQDLRGALKTPQTVHYPAITNPSEFGILLNAIDSYVGTVEVCAGLKLMPLLFVRAGELRHAEWDDFDLKAGTWTFTPRKTKRMTGVSLIVPLPTQAIEIISELAKHKRSKYLFPALHTTKQPISDGTLNQALKRLGYDSNVQTVHGFRASARTMIVEQLKIPEQLVELQLGHQVRDMHGRAYNRVQWIPERRDMMQKWADYLDILKKQ